MANGISRGTWDGAQDECTKLNILFDLMLDVQCRVKTLENRKWLHASLQFLGGAVGGAAAAFICLRALGIQVLG